MTALSLGKWGSWDEKQGPCVEGLQRSFCDARPQGIVTEAVLVDLITCKAPQYLGCDLARAMLL